MKAYVLFPLTALSLTGLLFPLTALAQINPSPSSFSSKPGAIAAETLTDNAATKQSRQQIDRQEEQRLQEAEERRDAEREADRDNNNRDWERDHNNHGGNNDGRDSANDWWDDQYDGQSNRGDDNRHDGDRYDNNDRYDDDWRWDNHDDNWWDNNDRYDNDRYDNNGGWGYSNPSRSLVQVDFYSTGNDDVTVSIEGQGVDENFSFDEDDNHLSVYLPEGTYEVHFRRAWAWSSWESGELRLGSTERVRIFFDSDDETVQVFDSLGAWSSDD
jgi:hypothetical protein